MSHRVYVASKIRHAWMWRELRDRGYPIVSTWIDDGSEHEVDLAEAWPRYLSEALSSSHVLVYAQFGERLKGGLFEIGAALAGGAQCILVGDVPPEMRTLVRHPNVRTVGTLAEGLAFLVGTEKHPCFIAQKTSEEEPGEGC